MVPSEIADSVTVDELQVGLAETGNIDSGMGVEG